MFAASPTTLQTFIPTTLTYKVADGCPGQVAQLAEMLSHTPKGCRFDSWSGHIPRLET